MLAHGRKSIRMAMRSPVPGLKEEERALINRVLDSSGQTVANIMTPWRRAVTVPANATVGQALDNGAKSGVNRMPMVEREEHDDEKRTIRVTGLVSLRDLLYEDGIARDALARDWASPPLLLREDTELGSALKRLQTKRSRLAVVVDGSQTPIGVVSAQDVLQAMFGDVRL